MKRMKRVFFVTIILCMVMTSTAWANEFTWDTVLGNHSQSYLLDATERSSRDTFRQNARGEYLAEGSVEIINNGNGEIYVGIYTYAYVYADRILHTVFLEYWDEDIEDWMQVDYWEFEKTKEEANNLLTELTTSLTLTGYPTGRYYRARGLHGVEYNDELEACATRTNGVLITD